jgi:hypothetical protein
MAGWRNGGQMAGLLNGGNGYSNGKNGGMVEWQEWRPNGGWNGGMAAKWRDGRTAAEWRNGRMAGWSNGKDGRMADRMAEWRPNGGMAAKWQDCQMVAEWRDGPMAEWSNGKNGGMVEWQEWRDC